MKIKGLLLSVVLMGFASFSAYAEPITIKGISWAMSPEQILKRAIELAEEKYGDEGGCLSSKQHFNIFDGVMFECGKYYNANGALRLTEGLFSYFHESETLGFSCELINACSLTQGELAQFLVDNLPIEQLNGTGSDFVGRADAGEMVIVDRGKTTIIRKGRFGKKGPSLN